MAVIRDPINSDNTVNYVATLAFFCGISCVTLMLKFGGFKASLNFYHGKKKNKEVNNSGPEISMTGAYRTNRDEFFGYSHHSEPQRKLTPAVRPTPPSKEVERPLRPAKSTSDLIKNKNLPPNLRQSNPNISQDPRGIEQAQNRDDTDQEPKKLDAEKRLEKQRLEEQKKTEKQRVEEQKKLDKQRAEEQKKLEKQRVEEQKKRDKEALQEQARQEKMRKEQEKRSKKKKAPEPTKPLANPLAKGKGKAPLPYPTNTLESSISRTSGPPPYSDVPKPDLVKNEADSSGNVSFSKPIDTGSWDLISQHRQQVNRPVNSTPDRKQMVMDLKYNMVDNNASETNENSEA